jgi:hypothetical protein
MKTLLSATVVAAVILFTSCKKSDPEVPAGPVIGPPTVITLPVTSFSPGFAFGGGNITNSGGDSVTIRGVAWYTLPNYPFGQCYQTLDGFFAGTYVSKMTVSPNTTYYVRAYAANGKGFYGYGQELSFTTP